MKLSKSKLTHYKKVIQNSKIKSTQPLNESANTQQLKKLPMNFISRNTNIQNKTESNNDILEPPKIHIKVNTNPTKINETINYINTFPNTIITNSSKKAKNFKEKTKTDSTIFVMKNFNYNKIYNININNKKRKSLASSGLLKFTYNKPKTTSAFNIYKSFDKSSIFDTTFNRSYNNSFNNFNKKNSYNNSEYLTKNNSFKNINSKLLSKSGNKKNNLMNLKKKSKIENVYIDFKNNNNNKKLIKNNSNNIIYNKSKCKINYSPGIFCRKIMKKIDVHEKKDSIKKYQSFYAINSNFNININDLIIFENKLNNIVSVLTVINSIKENNIINANDECKDFLIFYFENNLKGKFVSFFNLSNKIIVQSSINMLLFCIILCYYFSINHLVDNILAKIFNEILSVIKINFLLYIQQLLIKQKNENITKIFSYSLSKNKIDKLKEEKEIVNKIFSNCQNLMVDGLQKIISSYKKKNNSYSKEFVKIYNNISLIPENDFEDYFYKKLIYGNENEFIFHINEKNREMVKLSRTKFDYNKNKKKLNTQKKSGLCTSSLNK